MKKKTFCLWFPLVSRRDIFDVLVLQLPQRVEMVRIEANWNSRSEVTIGLRGEHSAVVEMDHHSLQSLLAKDRRH